MSIELQEIVATLQCEKERYDLLIANSMDELQRLRTKVSQSKTHNQKEELEQHASAIEAEISMLQTLHSHIAFKLRILEIKNHAS